MAADKRAGLLCRSPSRLRRSRCDLLRLLAPARFCGDVLSANGLPLLPSGGGIAGRRLRFGLFCVLFRSMAMKSELPDAGGGLRQPCPICRPAFCGLHGIQRCVVVLLLPDRHGTDMCRYGLDRMGQSGRQLSFRKPQPGSDRSGVSVLGVLFFRLLCLRFVRFFRLSDGLSLMRRGLFLRSEVQPRRPLHWAISWGFVVMMRYSSVSFGKWSTKGMMVFP